MRRRLRTQKRMREALLMDLGALVYELHRHGRRSPELLQAKAAELAAVDQEVRGLADALQADAGTLAIVAAGVAGSCENCGSLLSTDDRYCGACGKPAVPALTATAPAGGAQLVGAPVERDAPAVDEPAPNGGSAGADTEEWAADEAHAAPADVTGVVDDSEAEEEAPDPAHEVDAPQHDVDAAAHARDEPAGAGDRAPWLADEGARADSDGVGEPAAADRAVEDGEGRGGSRGGLRRLAGRARRGRDG